MSVNLAQSRLGKLNRLPIINRPAPFYLEEKMETKICSKCKERKPLSQFHQIHKNNKSYLYYYCRQCKSKEHKEYLKSHPWAKTFLRILTRTKYSSSESYERYKNRGGSITLNDLKTLWFRDKAWLLKRPSIDRIDNDKGYFLDNCRYIELGDNIRRNFTKNSYTIKCPICGKFMKST